MNGGMKRELALALEAQSLLNGSRGRSRSSKVQRIELKGTSETRSSKRLKGFAASEAESNGSIDRSREKSEASSLIDAPRETKVRGIQCINGVSVYTRSRRLKSPIMGGEPHHSAVKTVSGDDLKCNLATTVCEDENEVELTKALVNGESLDGIKKSSVQERDSSEAPISVDQIASVKNDVQIEAPRRFTRSALKEKVMPTGDSVSVLIECAALSGGESQVVSEVERSETGAVDGLGTPKKKLELKMSKKIALTKKPTKLKELLGSGLLEGCSVFYNGGNKASALRGMIKGFGILCSCELCKGCTIVTPCQFEIHALKTYRNAAQYICLDNGKSLFTVLNACKRSPLDTLEETIQSVIGSLPVRESIVCQNCKGSFFATFAAKAGQFCESCMKLKNLQTNPAQKTSTTARSVKPLVLDSSGSALVHGSSENKSQRRGNKKITKPLSSPFFKASARSSVRISLENRTTLENNKILKKSLRSALVSKSSLSPNRSREKITQKLSKSVPIPKSSRSSSQCISPQTKSRWKITKKDQRMHRLVFEEGGLPDGTEVAYYSRGQKLLEGYKQGLGIFCCCCQSEVSPSLFEAHAGWASRKKPYGYIYTSNGVSLHELAVSLLKGRKCAAKDNDDVCTICADGGNLLLCDGCPRAFHTECASVTGVPRGKWYCKYCCNMFQREKFVAHNANAVAAGRVTGIDPIEQITQRCIRIVKSPEEAEVIACVLCRDHDFSKSGFSPRTVILCDQCEKEYHVGCLKKHKMVDLKELPKGNWFCCMDCRKIFSALHNLLIRGEEKLPNSLLDVIKKKLGDKGSDAVIDFDIRWRLLSGKIASPETRSLLSKAVAIFHDRFDPIVDSATGRDFIPSMVYGRNIRGQDFGGMFCAVLTVNSSVVSTGILRVFGCEVAELPLVATSNDDQGKGYFQLLFSCIEKLLSFLKVRRIVLPAADEAESIWTNKFGFEKIPPEQLNDYRNTFWQMITFKGTSMLQKEVHQCQIIHHDEAYFDVSTMFSQVS